VYKDTIGGVEHGIEAKAVGKKEEVFAFKK